MHASLLFTAIALAGQLTGNNAGDRYRDLGPPPAATVAAPAGQDDGFVPFAQPSQVLPPALGAYQGQAQPSALPLQGGELGFETGADSSSNNTQTNIVASPQLKPSQLLRSMLEEPLLEKLIGTPLALADVVQGARTRGEQTRRVEAYWDLMAAVAEYYSSLQDVVRLRVLRASVSLPSPQWEQDSQLLEARVQAARRTANVAQHRLQRLLARSAGETLPLPSDLPHCGAYDTRYDEVFAGRPSKQAGEFNELISLNHQVLQNEVQSVTAANQWLQTVSQTRNPDTDGRGLLKAHELLTLRRRAFIDAVRAYNINIARYAELSTPGEVSRGRLISMLIYTTPEQRQNWASQGIQRTSAEEAIGSRQGEQGLTRRTTPPQRGVEHSILTQPGSGSR